MEKFLEESVNFEHKYSVTKPKIVVKILLFHLQQAHYNKKQVMNIISLQNKQ